MSSRRIGGLIIAGVTIAGLSLAGCQVSPGRKTESAATAYRPVKDVPYVPTPTPVVEAILKLANLNKNDVLYDLGSGDGRIVIEAARTYGARGVGIEIDPDLVRRANENARRAGVSGSEAPLEAGRVRFVEGNIFEADLSDATVVTLYLSPSINLRLRPKLLALRPGSRVISHEFDMGDWEPNRIVQVDDRTLYYWMIPPKKPDRSDTLDRLLKTISRPKKSSSIKSRKLFKAREIFSISSEHLF